MDWCFAIVNNKLAEIYFDKSRGKTVFLGHAYVDKKDFETKKEQRWIKEDTNKFKFIFRKGRYKSTQDNKVLSLEKKDKIYEDYKKGKNIFTANNAEELMEQLNK